MNHIIAFDEPTHTYTVEGKAMPSVTTILGVFNRGLDRVPTAILDQKARIGTAVHRACELDDAGQLDEASVHPVVAPYLQQWRLFRQRVRFDVISNEQRVFNPLHNYVGTADRIILFESDRSVLDIKTGIESPWHALQTAGYAAAAEQGEGVKIPRRFSLHLTPESYKLIEHKKPTDRPTFMAAVSLYHFMKANGEI
jgi:hypothetical protein